MTELQQRNEAFLSFLDSLNPAQRSAVDQGEGAVLVVAGPGTGKTHLLTARIGNILLKTDARPQNILCLTFTDAGASAMRQRLIQRIGPEAHQVPIFTFHAFCNRVIQDQAEYFSKGNPEPLTDLERIEMIRMLLEKLPPDHPLRDGKKDVFQFEEHLRDLFATMKKEGWSAGHIRKKCDDFLKRIPENPQFIYQKNGKNYRKGDPKAAQIQEVTEKIERLKAAADLFPKFSGLLEKSARYEYEDMLLWVLKAFEKNKALLLNYQERYQYILVDEFQDTNGAQFQLLQQLLDFWESPNVFIVGDDDQSIYEFQGARLQNLRDFQEKYANNLKTIVLEENYRSAQPILDAASRVIEHNTLRAVHLFAYEHLQKELKGQPNIQGDVMVAKFANRLQESVQIVHQIEQLIAEGTEPRDIAILYAKHRQADRILNLFEKKGIPYQTKKPLNILDLPLIRHIRSLLGYIMEESRLAFSGEYRLFQLLHADFWGLPPLDLAILSLSAQLEDPLSATSTAEKYRVREKSETGRKRWRILLQDTEALNTLELQKPAVFLELGKKLNQWISDAQNVSLPGLLEKIYSVSGLLQWALGQPDKARHLQILHTFSQFVQSEVLRHPKMGLQRLLDLLQSMDDNQLPLPVINTASMESSVQMLTAHAAKGLEFEHVFMLDCTEDTWDKNSGGNRGRFYLPDTLTRSAEEDALEARRRLFYVAMTRAKRKLQISFAAADDSGKPLTTSQFVAETILPHQDLSIPESLLQEAQTLLLLEPPKPVIMLPDRDLMLTLLKDYSLSVTSLNRYLRCPLAFYYEDVLKVPGSTSEAAAYGLAMHSTLQQFLLRMKAHKKLEWPSIDVLQKLFSDELERNRGFFSESNWAQRLALGKDALRRIHLEQVPFWRKRAIAERRFEGVLHEGVPIKGVLDKIEWLDNHSIRIVDYKTGVPDRKKTMAPTVETPFGGDYWRQLAFYQILLDQSRVYPEKVSKTAIIWLEPDKKGNFPVEEITFTPDDLRVVTQWMIQVFQQIKALEFSTGCGKADCTWCEMVREKQGNIPPDRYLESDLDDRN
ncbi:MAG TPA: ATP-dependent helicase [Saprospirales bacterium]|nr:ATP-dependent helicase [Saprospirales bacterium]